MAFSTFKTIGARAACQGGTSFANLAVNNTLHLANAKPIYSDKVLAQSTANAIENDTGLTEQVATEVRNRVEALYTPIEEILSYILDPIAATLLQSQDFINNIVALLYTIFIPYASPLIANDELFMNQLSDYVLTLNESILVSEKVVKRITDSILVALPNKRPFIQYYADAVVRELNTTYLDNLNNEINSVTNESYSYQFNVPPDILYNGVNFTIYTLTVKAKTSYTLSFEALFVSNNISVIRVTGVNTNNNTLYREFIKVTYATNAVRNVRFTSVIDNIGDSDFSLQLVVACQLTSGFATCQGALSVGVSLISYNVFPVLSFQSTMHIDAAARPIELYSGSVTPPVNSEMQPIPYSKSNSIFVTKIGTNFYNQSHTPEYYDPVNKGVKFPDYEYNGMTLFSSQNVVWFITLKFILNTFIVTCRDYSVYMVCNVNGRVTVNTPTVSTNIYNGGLPIMLIKFKSNGQVLWFANISSVAYSIEQLKGLSTDSDSNLYVYGTHPCGDKLFAYNSDFTFYSSVIEATPSQDSNGGLNKSNAFLLKYNSLGFTLGFATVKGYNDQSINNVYVDLNTNAVYLACSTNTTGISTVYTFNNTTLVVPGKGQGFIVRMNNLGASTVRESFAIVVPTSFNQVSQSFETDYNATVSAVQVCTNVAREMFGLYVTKADFIDLYDVDSTVNPSVASAVGKMVLTKYGLTGVLSWYVIFNSLFWVIDGGQHMCLDTKGDVFVVCRCASPLVLTNKTKSLVSYDTIFSLPPAEVDVNFVVKIRDVDQYISQLAINGYVVISNSVIRNMYSINDMIYVEYSYTNVSTVYEVVGTTYVPKIVVGELGKKGNCSIRICMNIMNTPQAPILSAVLIGFCIDVNA